MSEREVCPRCFRPRGHKEDFVEWCTLDESLDDAKLCWVNGATCPDRRDERIAELEEELSFAIRTLGDALSWARSGLVSERMEPCLTSQVESAAVKLASEFSEAQKAIHELRTERDEARAQLAKLKAENDRLRGDFLDAAGLKADVFADFRAHSGRNAAKPWSPLGRARAQLAEAVALLRWAQHLGRVGPSGGGDLPRGFIRGPEWRKRVRTLLESAPPGANEREARVAELTREKFASVRARIAELEGADGASGRVRALEIGSLRKLERQLLSELPPNEREAREETS